VILTPEQEAFEESVRTLARREFSNGYLRRARSEEFPWEELHRLGEHGLLCLSLPAENSGQDADAVSVGLACEHLAYADFNLAYLCFASELTSALLRGLAPEIADPVVKGLASGDRLLAVALTEPQAGSDAAQLQVQATPVEGGFTLRGEKTSITLGPHAQHAIVVATVDRSLGSKGTRRFLVDIEDATVHRQRFEDPGFRPLGRSGLIFVDTFVPAHRELVGNASGLSEQLADFDYTRTLLGLLAIGAARRAMDITVEWVRDREAFGQAIARFQGVSFTLAEHDTHLEAARWLCYRALALRAAGRRYSREAAMCKWWAPRMALNAINDCIVLHGHVGWSMEMPLQQLLLDVSGLQIGDGTPQIQKLVIARQLIGREVVG
jgi:cyclohexanecarboxyl-CoA dehydrogenase